MKKFQREWLLYKRQHQEFYLTIGFLALPLPENKEHSCYGDIREHTISFDLLGISENKQQTGKNFIGNVKIEGYHIYILNAQNQLPEESQSMLITNLITSKETILVFYMMNLNPYGLKLKTREGKTSCVAVFIATQIQMFPTLRTILSQLFQK